MNQPADSVKAEENNVKELLDKIIHSQAVMVSPHEEQWHDVVEDTRNQAFDEVEDMIKYLMAQAESRSIDWESMDGVKEVIEEWKISKGII